MERQGVLGLHGQPAPSAPCRVSPSWCQLSRAGDEAERASRRTSKRCPVRRHGRVQSGQVADVPIARYLHALPARRSVRPKCLARVQPGVDPCADTRAEQPACASGRPMSIQQPPIRDPGVIGVVGLQPQRRVRAVGDGPPPAGSRDRLRLRAVVPLVPCRQVGELGRGWTANLARRIEPDGDGFLYHDGAGSVHAFAAAAKGGFVSPPGLYAVLEPTNGGSCSATGTASLPATTRPIAAAASGASRTATGTSSASLTGPTRSRSSTLSAGSITARRSPTA